MSDHSDYPIDEDIAEQAELDSRRDSLLSTCSDQELCDECDTSHNPKIVSIRDYYKRLNKLSEKQRWALADYIANFSDPE